MSALSLSVDSSGAKYLPLFPALAFTNSDEIQMAPPASVRELYRLVRPAVPLYFPDRSAMGFDRWFPVAGHVQRPVSSPAPLSPPCLRSRYCPLLVRRCASLCVLAFPALAPAHGATPGTIPTRRASGRRGT